MRFCGKVALVTGAASGIGAATASRLADEGATVVRLDVHDGPDVQPCDVRDPDEVRARVSGAVAENGGVDVVVNVAGIGLFAPFAETSPAQWQDVLAVNLTGPFHVIQAALPTLFERQGNVVNVASVAGLKGLPYQAAYGASKAALLQLTRSLAVEYGARGIRFNAVCPGTVMTPLVAEIAAKIPADADRAGMARMQGVIPGAMEPSEVAAAIAYVASDDARSMTGQALTLDRGVIC